MKERLFLTVDDAVRVARMYSADPIGDEADLYDDMASLAHAHTESSALDDVVLAILTITPDSIADAIASGTLHEWCAAVRSRLMTDVCQAVDDAAGTDSEGREAYA